MKKQNQSSCGWTGLIGFFLVLSLASQPARAQFQIPPAIDSWEDAYGKSPTQFSPQEWQVIIDEVWGEGLPTSSKQLVFDRWWNEVNLNFGSFLNLDFDIFDFRSQYRPEILAGVSRGRFAAIMNHFGYRLKELHTYLWDSPVRSSPRQKGVPLFWIGQWTNNAGFGAVLTPLSDSTIVAYEVLDNHPLGLEPGDEILGYDGVPWKDIWPRLIEAELPLVLNSVNAGNDEGNWYYHMQSAGLNWHLFDTIDIVKYSSGDTLHLNTNLLIGENRPIWGRESIDVPGVEWPDRQQDVRFNWGIIDGTQIAYVIVTSWNFGAQYNLRERFRSAIDSVMHHVPTEGLIVDLRFNTGGGALANKGMELLFNERVETVGFEVRAGTADHLEMKEDPARRWQNLVIQGDPDTFYDKPIAVLIGPGSISAGELEATRLRFHPNARLFGRSSPASYSGSDFISLAESDWFASRTSGPVYRVDGHVSLSHIALDPDEWVWFDRDDIARREDTVVKAAVSWINSESATGLDGPFEQSSALSLTAYPVPSDDEITFDWHSGAPGPLSIVIYDVTGRVVARIQESDASITAGTLTWRPGPGISSGVYLYRAVRNRQQSSGVISLRR